eukprot:6200407-Pleurochrysis_carterae.AAC.1
MRSRSKRAKRRNAAMRVGQRRNDETERAQRPAFGQRGPEGKQSSDFQEKKICGILASTAEKRAQRGT